MSGVQREASGKRETERDHIWGEAIRGTVQGLEEKSDAVEWRNRVEEERRGVEMQSAEETAWPETDDGVWERTQENNNTQRQIIIVAMQPVSQVIQPAGHQPLNRSHSQWDGLIEPTQTSVSTQPNN